MRKEAKASRPVFLCSDTRTKLFTQVDIEFNWVSGMSISQWQKSILNLHTTFLEQFGLDKKIIDISSKSPERLGFKLSAFNLTLDIAKDMYIPIECAYQGSKVFEKGGPYTDLYNKNPFDTKKDPRIKNSGKVIGFRLNGKEYPIDPFNVFYDWLYVLALKESPLLEELINYSAFTDIAFNPQKSINSQARSIAIIVTLYKLSKLKTIEFNEFVSYFSTLGSQKNSQLQLF